jgi:hypothetical protein
VLFISTGEKKALPAIVVPLPPVTPTPAPVEVVRAPVVANVPVVPAIVPGPVVVPVVATVVAAAAAPDVPIVTPPPVVPLLMTGVGAELIDEFTVTCGLTVNAGETNCPAVG